MFGLPMFFSGALWFAGIAAFFAAGRAASAAALLSWRVSPTPTDAAGTYAEISGRVPGVGAAILAMIGVNRGVTLRVTARNVVLTSSGWSGQTEAAMPIRHIEFVEHGVRRPILRAFAWFAVLQQILGGALGYAFSPSVFAGLNTGGMILGVSLAAAIAWVYYVVFKSYVIAFVAGHTRIEFAMRGSVIEGVLVDEQKTSELAGVVRTLVDLRDGA